MKPAMTPQQERLTAGTQSPFALYREIAVGDVSPLHFAWYELCQFFLSGAAGIAGLGLRSLCYPGLFKTCGRRPAIGRGVVIRRPKSISLGSKVLADDYSVLDVRGSKGEIIAGNYVSIGRYTTISAKDGVISLGDAVNIGSYCRIATQSKVEIGRSTLVAAYCYIGPGNHQQGDDETPLIAREMEIKGGVSIGEHCWIGAHTTILDGVTIGEKSIIGAHSLVARSIPPGVVAAGVPARVVRKLNA